TRDFLSYSPYMARGPSCTGSVMRVVTTTVVATLLIAAGAAAAPASPNRTAVGVRSAPLSLAARPGPIDGAPALDEPGLDRGESARLLRRLQELLREVGIYDGTADGRWDSRLQAAIRDYQRRAGLTVDGRSSAALVQHLETATLRVRLGTRLEEEARKRKATIRKALLAQPETRELVNGGSPRPADRIADATRDPTPCFRAPTAGCLLREALESAKPEARTELRDWAYGDVAAVQARAGLTGEAFETAGQIQDPRAIVVALRHIAQAQAANGEVETALKTTSLVPNPLHRAEALAAIAEQQIGGDPRVVSRVLQELQAAAVDLAEPGPQASILAGLALGLWRNGERARATAVLGQARRLIGAGAAATSNGASWLGAIAAALAEMDRPGEALAVLERIDYRRHREEALLAVAKPLAVNGHPDLALAAARRIREGRYRAVALAHVAAAEAARGETRHAGAILDEALKAIKKIELPYAKGFAASRVAVTTARLAGLDQGIALAQEIGDVRVRARTLWQIVLIPAAAGDDAAVRRVHAEAVAATEAVDDVIERALAFAGAAIALVRAGRDAEARDDFDRALALAGSIRNPWGRAQALTKVAAALIALRASD
ncbi:MAG: peptidoglycan-binding domain-containing protein, partial [Kiloniellales bacterium]